MKPVLATGICLQLTFGAFAIASAQGQANDSAEVRTSGAASKSIRPNRASITLTFTATDSTARSAGARLAFRADSVRRALTALGIPQDSLFTASQWYWWSGRITLVFGTRCQLVAPNGGGCFQNVPDTLYRTTESIEVRMSDIGKVGRVIDAALQFGITDLSPIQFGAGDARTAQQETLREATLQAKSQAEAIATASGCRLGRIITLSTSGDDYSSRMRGDDYSTIRLRGGLSEMTVTGVAAGGPGTQITAPSITISATVYGRWRLTSCT